MTTTRDGLTQSCRQIFEAGLSAVDPYVAVARCLSLEDDELVLSTPDGQQRRYGLGDFRRVVIVGGGKATARMSQAVEELLGDRVTDGLIVVKYGHAAVHREVEVVEAGHPMPDQQGERGAQRIMDLLGTLGEDALVFSLISGGGSALLPMPAAGVSLAEKQEVTSLLLGAGADIGEMNAVRKHISGLKGGQLARAAHPATVVNLMLSDVVGDRLDVIASGPAVPDHSSFDDARGVLERRGIWPKTPVAIRRRIEAGQAGQLPDTPKHGDPVFERCVNAVIGSNIIALEACAEAARDAGFRSLVLSSSIEGETREIARMHAAMAREIRHSARPVAPPACIVSGGETTVTIRGAGKGGRNQEFALAAALDLAGLDDCAVFSAGTDGSDGPTDAAGAIVFGDTVARAEAAGLDPRRALEENDAYPFFERLDDLVLTGPTGTNVMDVHLVMVTG